MLQIQTNNPADHEVTNQRRKFRVGSARGSPEAKSFESQCCNGAFWNIIDHPTRTRCILWRTTGTESTLSKDIPLCPTSRTGAYSGKAELCCSKEKPKELDRLIGKHNGVKRKVCCTWSKNQPCYSFRRTVSWKVCCMEEKETRSSPKVILRASRQSVERNFATGLLAFRSERFRPFVSVPIMLLMFFMALLRLSVSAYKQLVPAVVTSCSYRHGISHQLMHRQCLIETPLRRSTTALWTIPPDLNGAILTANSTETSLSKARSHFGRKRAHFRSTTKAEQGDNTFRLANLPVNRSSGAYRKSSSRQGTILHSKEEKRTLCSRKRMGRNTNESKPSTKSIVEFNKEMSQIIRASRHGPDAVDKVDKMLWDRVEPCLEFPNRTSVLTFDVVSFNIVMLAWSRQSSWEGAERAKEWLTRLWRFAPHLQADSYSYGAVLNAYAKARTTKAAFAAEELLQQYVATAPLTTDSLHNAAMDAWASSGHPQAGFRAHALLRQLQASPDVQPSQISYNTCMKAFSNTPGHAAQAQELLEEMKQSKLVNPNKVSYTTCINAWAKAIKESQEDGSGSANRLKAVKEIRWLLQEMEDTYERTKDKRIQPDLYTYTAVLSAQALPPLELLSRMNKFGGPQQHPNAAFLNTCIHLLGQALEKRNRGRENAGVGIDDVSAEATTTAQVAETLLRQMQHHPQQNRQDGEFQEDPGSGTKACKVTYSSVIAVWAQCGTVEAALRAERLLDELVSEWERTRRYEYLPTAKTFCSVLTAWIKVASSDRQMEEYAMMNGGNELSIVDHALAIERRMHKLYERTKSKDLAPNTIIFVQIFQLMAKTRDPAAAIRAKDLLKQMENYAKQGHTQVRPDTTIYASFLNTLTKSGVHNVVELATHILEEVEEGYRRGMGHLKPNSLLYSAVLQSYAKSASPDGARLAEELLERTKRLFCEGKLYAKPTVLFYNAVMDAYARSNAGPKAAERAESLLFEMLRKSEAGDPTLKPRTRSYNAAILAWKNSKARDAPQRAEVLLRLMEDRYKDGEEGCRPDLVTYNSLVGVWAKSSQEDAPEKAKNILLFMEGQARMGDISLRPDRITYNSCIDAFARRGAAREAVEIFERMVDYYRMGYEEAEPDQITLTSLRAAWSKSSDRDAKEQIERAERFLRELQVQNR